jgi:ubiquinone/menaquinone biosynthesis C-methylase UbiE
MPVDRLIDDASPHRDGTAAVMQTASAFMASKHLFVAGELRLFEYLANGPLDLAALAAKAGAPPRTIRIIVDAVVSLGFIERQGAHYRNMPVAQALLTGQGSRDLRPLLRMFDRITYPSWMDLIRSVRAGQPTRAALDSENQRVLSEGVEAITRPAADALPHRYDFSQHKRLLDLGGGTGSFLCAVLQHHPHMAGTLVDIPAVTELARDRVRRAALTDRAEIVTGDILTTELPPGHDVMLVANVVHLMGPDRNKMLLQHARNSIVGGGRLLLVDFFTNPTHTHPLFAALMAGTFLIGFGEGDVYSEEEVAEWLEGTGWRSLGSQTLAGDAKLLVAMPA